MIKYLIKQIGWNPSAEIRARKSERGNGSVWNGSGWNPSAEIRAGEIQARKSKGVKSKRGNPRGVNGSGVNGSGWNPSAEIRGG